MFNLADSKIASCLIPNSEFRLLSYHSCHTKLILSNISWGFEGDNQFEIEGFSFWSSRETVKMIHRLCVQKSHPMTLRLILETGVVRVAEPAPTPKSLVVRSSNPVVLISYSWVGLFRLTIRYETNWFCFTLDLHYIVVLSSRFQVNTFSLYTPMASSNSMMETAGSDQPTERSDKKTMSFE